MKKIFILLMILLFIVGTSAQQRIIHRAAMGEKHVTLNPIINPTKDTLGVDGAGAVVYAETIKVDLTSPTLELKGFIGFAIKYDTIDANFHNLTDSGAKCQGVLPAVQLEWAILNPYPVSSIARPLATISSDSLMLERDSTTVWTVIEESLKIHDRWFYFDLTDSIPFTPGLMFRIRPGGDSIASTVASPIDTFRRINIDWELVIR